MRKSNISLYPIYVAHVVTYESSLGCIPLNLPDCHRHRLFLDWCTFKRATDDSIVLHERLKCPMLNCRRSFDWLAQVVDHIRICPDRVNATYWCPHCQQRENFHRQLWGSSDALIKRSHRRHALLRGTYEVVNGFGSEARQGVNSLKSLIINGKDLLKNSTEMRFRDCFTANKPPLELSNPDRCFDSSINEKEEAYCATDLPAITPSLSFGHDENFMQWYRSLFNSEMASPLSPTTTKENGHDPNVDLPSPLSNYTASILMLCDEQSTFGESRHSGGLDPEAIHAALRLRIKLDEETIHGIPHYANAYSSYPQINQHMENFSSTTLNATSLVEDPLWNEVKCKSRTALIQELVVILKWLFNLSFEQLCQDDLNEPLSNFLQDLQSEEDLVATAFATLRAVFLHRSSITVLQMYTLLHLAHACKVIIDSSDLYTIQKCLFEVAVDVEQCIIPEQRHLFIEITWQLWKFKPNSAIDHLSFMHTKSSETELNSKNHSDQNDTLKALEESVMIEPCKHFLDSKFWLMYYVRLFAYHFTQSSNIVAYLLRMMMIIAPPPNPTLSHSMLSQEPYSKLT